VFGRIDQALRKSITFDNDTAFVQHGLLRSMRNMTRWFCDAYASWQKAAWKLPRQKPAKRIRQLAVMPNRAFLWFVKALPYRSANLWLAKITENRAGVMDFVGQRVQQSFMVGCIEMLDVAHPANAPVFLRMAGCGIDDTIRA